MVKGASIRTNITMTLTASPVPFLQTPLADRRVVSATSSPSVAATTRRSSSAVSFTPSPLVSTSAQGSLEGRWTRRKRKKRKEVGKRRTRGKKKQEGWFISSGKICSKPIYFNTVFTLLSTCR